MRMFYRELAATGDGVGDVDGDAGGEHRRRSGGEEGYRRRTARDAFEEIDFGREFQDYLDPGYKTQEIEYKEDAPTFEQFLTRPPSLADHLEWQLHMSPIDSDVCRCGDLRDRQSERRRPSQRHQRRDGGDGERGPKRWWSKRARR